MKSVASQQKSVSAYFLACILFAEAGTIQAATTPNDSEMLTGLSTKTEQFVFEVPSLNEIQLVCRDDLNRHPRARCFYPSGLQEEVEEALAVHKITLEEQDSVVGWQQFRVLCDESNLFDTQFSITSSAERAVLMKHKNITRLETGFGESGARVCCYVPVSWAKSSILLAGVQSVRAYVFITKVLCGAVDAEGVVRWADACTRLASSFRSIVPSQREVLKKEIQSFFTAYQAAPLDEQRVVSNETLMGLIFLYVYLQGWNDFSAGEIAQWSNILASVSEQLEFSLWGNVSGEIQRTLDVIKRAVAAGESGPVATVRREITALQSQALENNTAVLEQVAAVQERVAEVTNEVADVRVGVARLSEHVASHLRQEAAEYFSNNGQVLFLEHENIGDNELRALVNTGNMAEVEVVVIRQCIVSVIPKWFFDACPNLCSLQINESQLERFELNSFNSCPDLRVIDVRGNRIHSFPAGLFDTLVALEHFDCSENRLEKVECHFRNSANLFYISFAYNDELEYLADDMLIEANHLRHCDFGGCRSLRRLPAWVMSSDALSTLFLHATAISQDAIHTIFHREDLRVNVCTLPDGEMSVHRRVAERFSQVTPKTLVRDQIDVVAAALAASAREWMSSFVLYNKRVFGALIPRDYPRQWPFAEEQICHVLEGDEKYSKDLSTWRDGFSYGDAGRFIASFKVESTAGGDAERIQKAIKALSVAITVADGAITVAAIIGGGGIGGLLAKKAAKKMAKEAGKKVAKEALKRLVRNKIVKGAAIGAAAGAGVGIGLVCGKRALQKPAEMWNRVSKYTLALSRLIVSVHKKFESFLQFCRVARLGMHASNLPCAPEERLLLESRLVAAHAALLQVDDVAVLAQLLTEPIDVWEMLPCANGNSEAWRGLVELDSTLEKVLAIFMRRLSMRHGRSMRHEVGEGELTADTVTPQELVEVLGVTGAVEARSISIATILENGCLTLAKMAQLQPRTLSILNSGDDYPGACAFAYHGGIYRYAQDGFFRMYAACANLYHYLTDRDLDIAAREANDEAV